MKETDIVAGIEDQDGILVVKFTRPIRHGRALDSLLAGHWLIEPMALAKLVAIAAGAGDPDQFSAAEGDNWLLHEPRSIMEKDGADAIISIDGAIFPKANLMTKHSGATSLGMVRKEFTAAMADASVKRIVLAINSPGGVTTGVQAFAQQVFNARDRKPVIAVAQDMAASAAYWIGSAASEFVGTGTAMVGSIGVVLTAMRSSKYEDQVEIVSSQSPKKRQDPGSESGRADLQALVDSMAQQFIDSVASYRGTTSADVQENFGQGGVVVGSQAVARGMLDGVSSRELVLSTGMETQQMTTKLTLAQVTAEYPEIAEALRAEGAASVDIDSKIKPKVDAARVEGATAERDRIKAVFDQSMVGHEDLIRTLAFDGKTSGAEAAVKVLAAEKQARTTTLATHREGAPAVLPFARETPPAPAAAEKTPEERWDANVGGVQQEFTSKEQFLAYESAQGRGLVKILRNKAAG